MMAQTSITWGPFFALLIGAHALDQTHHASHVSAADTQEQSSRRSLMRSEEQANVDSGVTDSTQEQVTHTVNADGSSRHAVNHTNAVLDEMLGERALLTPRREATTPYQGPIPTEGEESETPKLVAKWIITMRDTSWEPKEEFSKKDGGSCSRAGQPCKINYIDNNRGIADGMCWAMAGWSEKCWALLNEDHAPYDYMACGSSWQGKYPELKELCTYTAPTPAPTPYPTTPKPDEWESFNKFYIVLGVMGLGLITFGIYYYWYNYLQPGAHYGSYGHHGHHGHHGHGHGPQAHGAPPHMQGMHQQPPPYGQQPQGFAPTPQPMYPGQQQFGQMPQQQPYGQMPQQGFQRPPNQYG